jgi:F-type H+-transporting ATPase subunit a
MIEIRLAAEPIAQLGPIAITNSLLASWLAIGVIGLILVWSARTKAMRSAMEALVELLLSTIEGVVDDQKRAKEFLPLLGTFFVFIIINNWLGLLPGFGTILINHEGASVPLLRGGNADLNATVALAVISVVATQYYGMKHLGLLSHWKKYFNFKSPIMAVVGILELFSEFSKIVSFSFRLFGNIFAGEVLLIVIAFLVPVVVPLPFFGLEIFVGLIQAVVFMMLTLVFLTIATSNEEH